MSPRATLIALLALVAGACANGRRGGCYPCPQPAVPHSAPPPEIAAEDDKAITATEMRHVLFHSAPGIVMDIRRLSGTTTRTDPSRPPYFDDPRSFRLDMAYGEIVLGMSDLGHLVNDFVLAYPDAPLRNVAFWPEGERLKMEAELLRPAKISIEMVVDLCATADGKVCMKPVSVKAGGVPVAGLLTATGAKLDSMMDLSGAKGVKLVGNDLIMDASEVLPAPRIEGNVTSASMDDGRVLLVFGRLADAAPPRPMPRPRATSYMFFEHGTMRFGRLFMIRADMQILDADQSDPFDFELARYDEQLIAGYSRNQTDGGMLVVMPDLDDMDRGAPVPIPAVPGAH